VQGRPKSQVPRSTPLSNNLTYPTPSRKHTLIDQHHPRLGLYFQWGKKHETRQPTHTDTHTHRLQAVPSLSAAVTLRGLARTLFAFSASAPRITISPCVRRHYHYQSSCMSDGWNRAVTCFESFNPTVSCRSLRVRASVNVAACVRECIIVVVRRRLRVSGVCVEEYYSLLRQSNLRNGISTSPS